MHKPRKPGTITRFACASLALAPLAAMAYIGPGAGLSLLGALWALVVALATALVFLFAWPIRRMRRRRREALELEADNDEPIEGQLAPVASRASSARHTQENRETRNR